MRLQSAGESVHIPDMGIPDALEFRRECYGWTQAKMAKKLGIGAPHYSEIIHGKRSLPYKAACKAFALGVPANVLLKDRK